MEACLYLRAIFQDIFFPAVLVGTGYCGTDKIV